MPLFDNSRKKPLYPTGPVLLPALKFGAFSGASGLAVGGITGTIRSSTPILFAAASGLQCFALGSTFSATRAIILHAWEIGPSSPPEDHMFPSAVAGGLTGATIGGLIRGRHNIFPAGLMFTLFGYSGQYLYNYLDARNTAVILSENSKQREPQHFWQRVANLKWSPIKSLSDEEYADILKEKLAGIDMEIAVLDDDIKKIREKAPEREGSIREQ